MNPVIGASYPKLMNLFKVVRKQNSTSIPFQLCVHQPGKYWLGQLNIGGIIFHIILFWRARQFSHQVIASVELFLTQKMV